MTFPVLLLCLAWLLTHWPTMDCKEQIEKEIMAVRAAQQQPGLSPGDIALLKAREASLGLALTAGDKHENRK